MATPFRLPLYPPCLSILPSVNPLKGGRAAFNFGSTSSEWAKIAYGRAKRAHLGPINVVKMAFRPACGCLEQLFFYVFLT